MGSRLTCAVVACALVAARPAIAAEATGQQSARALYDRAFAESAAGHDAAAREILERLVRDYPDDPAAAYGRELLRLIDSRKTGAVTPRPGDLNLKLGRLTPPVDLLPDTLPSPPAESSRVALGRRLRDEKPTTGALVLLLTTQPLNGLLIGTFATLGGVLQPYLPEFVIAGGLAGLFLPLGLTWSEGVTMGHALALSAGSFWGFLNGEAGALLLNTYASSSVLWPLSIGMAGGTLIGELVWRLLRPGAGDVALASSMMIWGTIAPALIGAALGQPTAAVIAETLVFGNVSLLMGSILAWQVPMSIARVSFINIVGALSGMAGLGLISFLAYATAESSPGWMILGAAGGYFLGIALGAALTPRYDLADLPAPQLTLLPTWNGGWAGGLAFRF